LWPCGIGQTDILKVDGSEHSKSLWIDYGDNVRYLVTGINAVYIRDRSFCAGECWYLSLSGGEEHITFDSKETGNGILGLHLGK
jgi:hypothetical protein